LEDLTPIGLLIVTAILIVAMTNPFLLAPMMIGATGGMSKAKQRSVAVMAVVVGGGILIGSIFIGNTVLNLFGISTTALQVAGGLIFIQIGFGMLGSNSNRPSADPAAEQQKAEAEAQADGGPNPGVFPLGMPGIGGPGLIAISIGVAGSFPEDESTIYGVAMAAGVLVAMGIVFVVLMLAPKLAALLGAAGIDVVTKIMGLIVLALAVVLITTGLGELWPGLMG
jgi:multiple antibiotic resistance protein